MRIEIGGKGALESANKRQYEILYNDYTDFTDILRCDDILLEMPPDIGAKAGGTRFSPPRDSTNLKQDSIEAWRR